MVVYIFVLRGGISEIELEDVLFCDDMVLDEVFVFWMLYIWCIFVLLLFWVKFDIEFFFVVYVENGICLLFWKYC